MSFVLRIQHPASGTTTSSYDGQLVMSFDPEAYGGRGHLTVTGQPGKALHFPTREAALDFWRQSPRCAPKRPDGQPNRPLTFFSILVEPLPS